MVRERADKFFPCAEIVCVCVYICLCMCVYVSMCVCAHVCMCVCMSVCVYAGVGVGVWVGGREVVVGDSTFHRTSYHRDDPVGVGEASGCLGRAGASPSSWWLLDGWAVPCGPSRCSFWSQACVKFWAPGAPGCPVECRSLAHVMSHQLC